MSYSKILIAKRCKFGIAKNIEGHADKDLRFQIYNAVAIEKILAPEVYNDVSSELYTSVSRREK